MVDVAKSKIFKGTVEAFFKTKGSTTHTDEVGVQYSTLNKSGPIFSKSLRHTLADTKRVPTSTYYCPRVGMLDPKDVYSKTNLKRPIGHTFSKSLLPWQKMIKPIPGERALLPDPTERQVFYPTLVRCFWSGLITVSIPTHVWDLGCIAFGSICTHSWFVEGLGFP